MVKIFTDSTSCLSPEMGRQHGIAVVPQTVNFAGQVLREWVDLDPAGFIARLKITPELPKSAPVSEDEFADALRPLVETGETIICLHPSRKVSKTLEIVQAAAKRFPGADIRHIDTQMIASPMATLALLCAEWSAQGRNADQIEARLREMIPYCRLYFLVPTLDYLARGGRIGGAAALLGNLLQLKPILTFKEGQVDQFAMTRTFRHGMVRLQELIFEVASRDSDNHLSVMHAGDPEQGQALARDLAWKLGVSKIPVYDIPPTVACHTGPGTMGIAFFVGTWQ